MAEYKESAENEDGIPIEDNGEKYHVTPVLILPNKDQLFVQINTCESHCYHLEGAVFIKQFFSTEGFVGLGLVPVDVHKNAWLNKRYNCRVTIERSRTAMFDWLQCLR